MIEVPNTQLQVGRHKIGQPQTYHLAGPIEGPWWTKYSWWVIPLGVTTIVLLSLGTAGCFDQKTVVATAPSSATTSPIVQEAAAPTEVVTTPLQSSLPISALTTADIEIALSEANKILTAVDDVRAQVKGMVEAEESPDPPTPTPTPVVASVPRAPQTATPPKPPTIWDLNR